MNHEIQNTTESIIGRKLSYHLLNNQLIDVIRVREKSIAAVFQL